MEMPMTSTSGREGQHVDGREGAGWPSKVFQLDPAGLRWPLGVVIFDVVLVPLVVFWAIGHEEYLLSAVFGVVFTALTDPGGRFGSRAARNAGFALIGAGLGGLAFGLGGAAWGWSVLAVFAVTLVGGLAIMFGVHRFVAGMLLNAWFIIALILGFSFDQAHISGYTWAQLLSWAGGAALWMGVTFIAWLIGGRRDQPRLIAEIPGDTSRHPLTGPAIIYALIRAVVVAGTFAIAFGANLSHGYWMSIAAFVALQPSLEQSILVGAQRLVGALIGAAAAALLMLIPANETGTQRLLITFGLQVVALALYLHAGAIRFWNYAIYTAAIAAGALILVDLPQPTTFRDEGERVLWTLCGVAIAVVVMWLASLLAKPAAVTKQPAPADRTR